MRVNILLLHNIVSPYRIPLFNEIAKTFNVTVFFCRENDGTRKWQTTVGAHDFESVVLEGVKLFGLIFNYGLLSRLLNRNTDYYIIAENGGQTLLSTVTMLLVSKVRSIPLLVWSERVSSDFIQERSLFGTLKSMIKRGYLQFLYSQADGFIALGTKAKSYLENRGVPSRKVAVGPQVMPSELVKTKVTCPKGSLSFSFLTIAYLSRRKGVRYLVEAFKNISLENLQLIVAGTGPEKKSLQKAALGDDRIKFPGYVADEKKWCAFENADVFVLPTLHDPWGLVVNEALHFGLPVIVTSAAGCADHLVDGNGFVVEPGNPYELQKAMTTLVQDSQLREKMGERSYNIADDLTLEEGVRPFVRAINILEIK